MGTTSSLILKEFQHSLRETFKYRYHLIF